MCVSNPQCKSIVEQVSELCCLKFKNSRDAGLKVQPDRIYYEYYDGSNGEIWITDCRTHLHNCACRAAVKYASILYELCVSNVQHLPLCRIEKNSLDARYSCMDELVRLIQLKSLYTLSCSDLDDRDGNFWHHIMSAIRGRPDWSGADHCSWQRSRAYTQGQWHQLMLKGLWSRTALPPFCGLHLRTTTCGRPESYRVVVWTRLQGFCPECVPWKTYYEGWWQTIQAMHRGSVRKPDRLHQTMWIHLPSHPLPCTSGEGPYPGRAVSMAGGNDSQNMWHRCNRRDVDPITKPCTHVRNIYRHVNFW